MILIHCNAVKLIKYHVFTCFKIARATAIQRLKDGSKWRVCCQPHQNRLFNIPAGLRRLLHALNHAGLVRQSSSDRHRDAELPRAEPAVPVDHCLPWRD